MIPNSLTPSTAFRRLNLNRAFAVKAALAYLLMGSTWILATSRLVDRFTQDPQLDDLAEIVSNGLLVGATALSLGLVLDFCFRRMERSTRLLQEAEERWRHALEGACEGVWDWNAQTNEVFYSPEWKGMLGFGPQEIGNTFVEWESRVHPDDLPQALAMVKRHLEGQSPFYLSEHRIRCKDGTFKWILARGKVVAWTSEGKPLHVRGTHSDISEQKRAEESLRQRLELQDQLAKVAASVPGLICSFKLHPDGSVSMPFATAAIADLYGVQPEDVREDFSSVLNRVHPDDRDHLHKGIQESARSMEPWHDVFRIQHPSKGERWVDGHSVPRLEPDGSILWHGFVQDITVPTLAAISLRRQEERLRLALDAAEMVTWELDIPSGRLTYSSNPAALAGSEAIGQHLSLETFLDQVHPDDRAATQDAIQAAIQEGKLFNSEYRVRLPDGSWQWLAGRGRTIAGPDGACRQVIGVSQDITQRKCAGGLARQRKPISDPGRQRDRRSVRE